MIELYNRNDLVNKIADIAVLSGTETRQISGAHSLKFILSKTAIKLQNININAKSVYKYNNVFYSHIESYSEDKNKALVTVFAADMFSTDYCNYFVQYYEFEGTLEQHIGNIFSFPGVVFSYTFDTHYPIPQAIINVKSENISFIALFNKICSQFQVEFIKEGLFIGIGARIEQAQDGKTLDLVKGKNLKDITLNVDDSSMITRVFYDTKANPEVKAVESRFIDFWTLKQKIITFDADDQTAAALAADIIAQNEQPIVTIKLTLPFNLRSFGGQPIELGQLLTVLDESLAFSIGTLESLAPNLFPLRVTSIKRDITGLTGGEYTVTNKMGASGLNSNTDIAYIARKILDNKNISASSSSSDSNSNGGGYEFLLIESYTKSINYSEAFQKLAFQFIDGKREWYDSTLNEIRLPAATFRITGEPSPNLTDPPNPPELFPFALYSERYKEIKVRANAGAEVVADFTGANAAIIRNFASLFSTYFDERLFVGLKGSSYRQFNRMKFLIEKISEASGEITPERPIFDELFLWLYRPNYYILALDETSGEYEATRLEMPYAPQADYRLCFNLGDFVFMISYVYNTNSVVVCFEYDVKTETLLEISGGFTFDTVKPAVNYILRDKTSYNDFAVLAFQSPNFFDCYFSTFQYSQDNKKFELINSTYVSGAGTGSSGIIQSHVSKSGLQMVHLWSEQIGSAHVVTIYYLERATLSDSFAGYFWNELDIGDSQYSTPWLTNDGYNTRVVCVGERNFYGVTFASAIDYPNHPWVIWKSLPQNEGEQYPYCSCTYEKLTFAQGLTGISEFEISEDGTKFFIGFSNKIFIVKVDDYSLIATIDINRVDFSGIVYSRDFETIYLGGSKVYKWNASASLYEEFTAYENMSYVGNLIYSNKYGELMTTPHGVPVAVSDFVPPIPYENYLKLTDDSIIEIRDTVLFVAENVFDPYGVNTRTGVVVAGVIYAFNTLKEVKATVDYKGENSFFEEMFKGCVNLVKADLSFTNSAGITAIGNSFLYDCFRDCSALTAPISLESLKNFNITSIGSGFMRNIYQNCTAITQPQSLQGLENWQITAIPNNFLIYIHSVDDAAGVKGSLTACIDLTPIQSWNISAIGNYFLSYLYENQSLNGNALMDITPLAAWANVTTIGTNFSYATYRNTGLTGENISDFSSLDAWVNLTSVGNGAFRYLHFMNSVTLAGQVAMPNWLKTFMDSNSLGAAYNYSSGSIATDTEEPKYSDGSYLSSWGQPALNKYTYTGRDGIIPLFDRWK